MERIMEKKFHIDDLIDGLKMSEHDKKLCKLYNALYYKNYIDGKIKSPLKWKECEEYLRLPLQEKINLFKGLGSRQLAAFIGPLSYLVKGMWGPFFAVVGIALAAWIILNILGIVLMSIGLPVSITAALAVYIPLGYLLISAIVGNTMIDRDFFYHKCLKNKAIKPYLTTGQIDILPRINFAAQ